MKLEGMPFPMPSVPVSYTQCLTKKDMVPQKKEKNQDCKMISNKTEGNAVSWVMQCKDRNGTTDSTGKVTYKGIDPKKVRLIKTKNAGPKQLPLHGSCCKMLAHGCCRNVP